MAKKTILKERDTNQELYPITTLDCITDFPKPEYADRILTSTNNGMEWKDFNDILLNNYTYGVEWKPNVADPTLTRVGNMEYHRTLPIQSGMKGCIYNPKEKMLVYWLDEDNWYFKQNNAGELLDIISIASYSGNTLALNVSNEASSKFLNKHLRIKDKDGHLYAYAKCTNVEDVGGAYTLTFELYQQSNNYFLDGFADYIFEMGTSRLDGYDGEVMVYVPEFWIKSWDEPDRRCVRISPVKIDNTWEHQPAVYLGAYRDTILNEVPEDMGYLSTLEVDSAISVANTEPYCRGGKNRESLDEYLQDDPFRTDLGKCRIYINRPNFRHFARFANKEIMSYRQYKNIIYWLWVIEYATFNSQAPFNYRLTSEGYHQGGMGPGSTLISSNIYGSPIFPNGYTNERGNKTRAFSVNIGDDNTWVSRWRGLENIFGDAYHIVDGIIIYALSRDIDVYITSDPSKYFDYLTGDDYTFFDLRHANFCNDYVKEFNLGSTAEILPRSEGGSPTEYKCDICAFGGINDASRFAIFGGASYAGENSGIGMMLADGDVEVEENAGIRTVCIAE